MYGGQSSKGFLVDHYLLLSKQRTDAGETGVLQCNTTDWMQ